MILVTGSAGRVGRAVVAALRAGGRTVRGLDLKPSGTGREETVGSLEDAQAISKAMVGVSAVLHLGAFMSWVPADRDRMFATNVEGTRRLLDAASAVGVRRFVFASSGEVYPENRPEFLPVTEDHPLRPNSPYGLTKLLGEELVGFYQRTSSMETVILRFSHTQDAAELLDEDSFFSGPRFFLRPRIRQQQNFGNTAIAELLQSKDIDEPSHILLALDHPEAAGGTFNLGADEPVDFAALLPKIAALTGLPIVTVDFPGDGVYYHTSNERIRNKLGFEAEWTMDRMLNDAAAARRGRCAKEQRR